MIPIACPCPRVRSASGFAELEQERKLRIGMVDRVREGVGEKQKARIIGWRDGAR